MMAVNEEQSSELVLLASADGFKAYDDGDAYYADPSSEYNYQSQGPTKLPCPPQSEAAYEYWEELIDPESGFTYYQNSYTGESRWDMPLVAAASAEPTDSTTTEQQLALVPIVEGDATAAAASDADSQLVAVEEPEVSLATLRQQKLELLAMVHAVAALKTVTAAACRRVIAYRRAERKRHMDQVRRAQLSVRAHRGLASTKRGGAAAAKAVVSRSSLSTSTSSADVLAATAAVSDASSSALVSTTSINSNDLQLEAGAAAEAVPAAATRLSVTLAHLKSSSPWVLPSTTNNSNSSSISGATVQLQQPRALLRSIELTGDGIGDTGVVQLSNALKGGSGASLTYLSLAGNGITPKVSLIHSVVR
jgi:WW domain